MGIKCRMYADIISIHPGVTGSCNLVVVKLPNGKTIKFIVDCWMFQGEEAKRLNNKGEEIEERNYSIPLNPDNLDFCLVTHNHVDHTGRLPFLVKKGFNKNIYATETTSKLIRLALEDSTKVVRDISKRNNREALYTDSDTSKTLSLIKPCKYNEPIQVDENVKVTFLINGHLLGAALILVQISYPDYEDINILFTGDYNNKNMFFDVPSVPEWILNLELTIVQESTYGDMNSSSIKPCFKENVIECIKNDGTVIAPVFSLGRSQEILYELKSMQKNGILDASTPIFLDGKLAIRYTNMYLNDGLDIKSEMRDFLPANFNYVDKSNRQEVLQKRESKIILTTSGMGSYGPAQLYIPEYITRGKSLIHFTGYTAPDTLGGRLKSAKQGDIVEIGGMRIKKSARVEYTTEYSAHAKADEMIAFLTKFQNVRLILLNHGEESVKNAFSEKILSETPISKVGVLGNAYIFRIDHWGLVKSMSSKFER